MKQRIDSPYINPILISQLPSGSTQQLLGGTGGQLTYQYGINVRGVNPLLHESWESKVINESSQEIGSNTDH